MARTREAGMEDRILDSAFAVFGERGFQATTLKEIASGAGISSGSVYTYFPDKETLFREAVNRGWASFIEEVEIISRGGLSRDERVAVLLDRGFSSLGRSPPPHPGHAFRGEQAKPGQAQCRSALPGYRRAAQAGRGKRPPRGLGRLRFAKAPPDADT